MTWGMQIMDGGECMMMFPINAETKKMLLSKTPKIITTPSHLITAITLVICTILKLVSAYIFFALTIFRLLQ